MEDETDSADRSPRHQGHVPKRVWATALTLAFFGCGGSFAATAPLGAGPAGSFRRPVSYLISRDGTPFSIAIGDLNGDGSSDLVAGDLGGAPSPFFSIEVTGGSKRSAPIGWVSSPSWSNFAI
jgi:hypothetical protein